MAIHLQPLQKLEIPPNCYSVFMAGSIDNGKAEPWQDEVVEHFKGQSELVLLNPRRDDWDAALDCSISNPVFKAQVEWEIQGLETADMIAMYFAPNSKAPITLLEFGLFAQSNKMVVCCPNGFWRKGNVDIVCEKFNIPQVESLNKLIEEIENRTGKR